MYILKLIQKNNPHKYKSDKRDHQNNCLLTVKLHLYRLVISVF